MLNIGPLFPTDLAVREHSESLFSGTENQICTNSRRFNTSESFNNRVMTWWLCAWPKVAGRQSSIGLTGFPRLYPKCRSRHLRQEFNFPGTRFCIVILLPLWCNDVTQKDLRLWQLAADWSYWLVLKRLSDSSEPSTPKKESELGNVMKLDETFLNSTSISSAFCAVTSLRDTSPPNPLT